MLKSHNTPSASAKDVYWASSMPLDLCAVVILSPLHHSTGFTVPPPQRPDLQWGESDLALCLAAKTRYAVLSSMESRGTAEGKGLRGMNRDRKKVKEEPGVGGARL